MRVLDPADLGVLLSVFALLLIFFGIDFRFSRKDASRHHRRTLAFAIVNVIGEGATALALVLTWVALFLPPEAEGIDTWLVFVPGSFAMLCAVILTAEVVATRIARLGDTGTPSSGHSKATAPANTATGAKNPKDVHPPGLEPGTH